MLQKKISKKKLLSFNFSFWLTLLCHQYSLAEETPKQPDNLFSLSLEQLMNIEVTSYRGSIISSLNAKRTSNSVMDSITADDIGSFPDDNVAESLQRIPGVSITRSLSGEGESVSIRGFGPGKNLYLVNGQQVISSAFNFENALNRGYNYSILPTTIVLRAEVYKSSQAYLPEGGVGGTVNIVTRKPLNQNKELLLVTSGSVGHNTLADSYNPKVSGLVSWKPSDTWGILASLDYSDKETRRDSNSVLAYIKQSFTTQDGTDFNDVIVPSSIGTAVFTQNLKRRTGMVTLQYQPTDALEMSFNYLRSDVEGHNFNTALFSLNHQFTHIKPGTVLDATLNEANNTITNIDYAAPANGRAGWVAASYRDTELFNESYHYEIKWFEDNLTLKAAIGASNSSGGPGDVNAIRTVVSGRSNVSIDDGIGYTRFHDTDVNNLGDAGTWGHGGGAIFSENENSFLTLDGEYYFDDSFFASLQFGGRFTKASQDNRHLIKGSDYHQVTGAHDDLRSGVPASFLAELSSTPIDFHNTLSDNAYDSYQYIDPRNIDVAGLGIIYNTRPHQANSFKIEEETTAFYLQANFKHNFDSMTLRGNIGVRSSNQKTTTHNFSTNLNWRNAGDLAILNAFSYDYSDKGESDNILPSANLALDLQNDWVIRGAYSTVISRPEFTQLAQQLFIKDIKAEDQVEGGATRTAQKGNANLEAFEANKYDLSAEWYYNEGSSISLGVFYYDVKTFVTNQETEEDLLKDGDLWIVSQPVNKNGGSLTGFELALSHQFTSLPAPFNGLGMQLNYTYIDSETKALNPLNDEQLPLIGLSESTYNAVFFYSTDKWDARLSYNYRDSYYEQLQFEMPRFSGEIERLTAKVKYKFENNISLYIEGSNLTDHQDTRYIGDESRPMRTGVGGRNFAVGFNYSF